MSLTSPIYSGTTNTPLAGQRGIARARATTLYGTTAGSSAPLPRFLMNGRLIAGGAFVLWVVSGTPDLTGALYPGGSGLVNVATITSSPLSS